MDLSPMQHKDASALCRGLVNMASTKNAMLTAGAANVIKGRCLAVIDLKYSDPESFRTAMVWLEDALSACRDAIEGV